MKLVRRAPFAPQFERLVATIVPAIEPGSAAAGYADGPSAMQAHPPQSHSACGVAADFCAGLSPACITRSRFPRRNELLALAGNRARGEDRSLKN
jgi:hypothetical protein